MIVAKRYILSFKRGGGAQVILIGDRNKLDEYVASKFGVTSISSVEELDGIALIHPELLKDENQETIMLNSVYYN